MDLEDRVPRGRTLRVRLDVVFEWQHRQLDDANEVPGMSTTRFRTNIRSTFTGRQSWGPMLLCASGVPQLPNLHRQGAEMQTLKPTRSSPKIAASLQHSICPNPTLTITDRKPELRERNQNDLQKGSQIFVNVIFCDDSILSPSAPRHFEWNLRRRSARTYENSNRN